jgi:FKBP-type peptidyl-prolyl cis-trans isomerase FkpA
MTMRALLPCLLLLLAAGCAERLSGPECRPVEFSQASVSGDTITTTTGLRYLEGETGEARVAEWCLPVAIHYDAFLLDGTLFDSSRPDGAPLVFTPGFGALIDGIEQGVIGVHRRGTRRLIIPPALGFGSTPRRDNDGRVVVPANSTVVYDIEVVEIAQ